MQSNRKNFLLQKLEDIKDAITEGHNRLLLLGLSQLLTIIVGIVVIIEKLSALIDKLGEKGAEQLLEKKEAVTEKAGSLVRSISGAEAVEKTITDAYTPVSAYNMVSGAGLSVTLDTGGRVTVEVWVKSDVVADFKVYGSSDGNRWRLVDTISLGSPGELSRGYMNAYRWVKVETSAVGNNEIEITASR